MSYLLPRYIGSARAFELLLTGRPFDAAEAERIGLVARVVARRSVDRRRARAWRPRSSRNSPLAMWLTKQVVWSNLDASSFESAIELENRTQVLASMSRDSAEAMRAFVEKRPAVFSGE